MSWIPEYPVERQIIKTYKDGRFGLHEYSVWPQPHIESMVHVICIPRKGAAPHLPSTLWTSLDPDKHWAASDDVAVVGLGYLLPELRKDFARAAQLVVQELPPFERVPAQIKAYGQFLVLILRQCVLRMESLATGASRAVSVAAHVQRLCLELAGLKTYLEVVVPRLESPHDFSHAVLPVVGAFFHEGADIQTWWRVGIPVWFVQPLSRHLVVWEVVSPLPPDGLSSEECDPPILHTTGAFIGVANLTGNWLSSMVMAVSKHVAGTHLSRLNLSAAPNIASDQPPSKRARHDERTSATGHLQMSTAEQRGPIAHPGASKKPTRRGGKGSGGPASESNPQVHPTRMFSPSMLFDVPPAWAAALTSATPVVQTNSQALYFYPPPFLIDCLSASEDVPEWVLHPEHVQVDPKVDRYLHNLARIRLFCRSRLFDASLTNKPLSVIEWKTALWGEYSLKAHAPQGKKGSTLRRELRRQGWRNRTIDMFRKIARMDSYDPDSTAALGELAVKLETVKSDAAVRRRLVWEAYEINFRAEVMALDTVMVQTEEWQEIRKWEREAVVARIWGEVSGMSVLPAMERSRPVCLWFCPPDPRWGQCKQALRAFVDVLRRWPGAPDPVVYGLKETPSAEEFAEVQRAAVGFYVDTFVRTFWRLPTPPVCI